MKTSWIAALALVLLSSCKETIEVKNGEIPEQYLSYAKPFMGTYRGRIDGLPADLTLKLNGSRVVLFGTEPLSTNCQSSYGELLRIRVKKVDSKYVLAGADFSFDPNNCRRSVRGREVNLDIKENVMKLALLTHSEVRWDCPWMPGYPPGYYQPGYGPGFPPAYPGYGPNPVYSCNQRLSNQYIFGTLRK